ncbi:hypothetical protein BDA96_02G380300 [Sorghum bicolor]|uniref:Uncharacterized protein n=1 Tax=Sorghum bicolor TaxID=4558 RepID=A0A921UV12_SORBI|nr:hypothetical protein BDA96_02G380300 [Sorghum bicolor]
MPCLAESPPPALRSAQRHSRSSATPPKREKRARKTSSLPRARVPWRGPFKPRARFPTPPATASSPHSATPLASPDRVRSPLAAVSPANFSAESFFFSPVPAARQGGVSPFLAAAPSFLPQVLGCASPSPPVILAVS